VNCVVGNEDDEIKHAFYESCILFIQGVPASWLHLLPHTYHVTCQI
jgi:hypothetical protein